MALLFGICLVFDGAFNRGLFVSALPSACSATVAVIRIAEVVTGGMVFVLLGFGLSNVDVATAPATFGLGD
jgi:hypothetical protein